MLKVLDFSADIDRNPESNGEYTSANLEAGPLPKSFTICSAFMVEAWTTDYAGALMFVLFDVNGNMWGYVDLATFPGYTKYDVRIGPLYFVTQTEVVFFPLHWSHVCLSVDSLADKVMLVVDGQLLGEEEYKREEDEYKPNNHPLLQTISTGLGGAQRKC